MKKRVKKINRIGKWETFSRLLRVVEIVAIVIAVIFATVQIRDIRNMQSAQLMLDFNNQLSTDKNLRLIVAIEEDEPIFKKTGGEFTTADIDQYLGIYELLNNVSEIGLISDDMLYNAFSYDIIKTYQNKEIQDYLSEIRQEDSYFFLGFEILAEDIISAEAYYYSE